MKTQWMLGLALLAGASAWAGEQTPRLTIEIVEGKDAINNTRQRTSREVIIEVQDENHKPVAGAAVVFLLPGEGPGGSFAGGAKSATAVTNATGRAPKSFQPNQVTGNFQVRVNASFQGRTATATIPQSNTPSAAVATSTAAAHAGISAKAIGIIVAVAAAGAAGAAVGLRSKSNPVSATMPPTPPTGTIAPGTATIGPPQ